MATLPWLAVLACLPLAAQISDPAPDPLEQGYRSLREGDDDGAVVWFQRAAEGRQAGETAWRELAYAYLRTGQERRAQQVFEQVLASQPPDTRIAIDLAFSYQRTGEIDRAKWWFSQAAASDDRGLRVIARRALNELERPSAQAAPGDVEAEPLGLAYAALAARDYETAILHFQEAVKQSPQSASIRKELGYAYLKIGEAAWALEMFEHAVRLSPDGHTALELAFLLYETGEQARAFEIFGRLRANSDPQVASTARGTYERIDEEWTREIERWEAVIAGDPVNRSAQLELGDLYEKHGQPRQAVERYLAAWLVPSEQPRDPLLLKLARARQAAGDNDGATGAWLLASRSQETRIAEEAKDHLPARHPYAAEFRRALELDPRDTALRRELAYLWLAVGNAEEARREFELVVQQNPDDLLAAAQLAFLYLERKNEAAAVELLERARNSSDEDVARRAREKLQEINAARARPDRELGERSLQASYLKDAREQLLRAYELNSADDAVALKLGIVHNLLRQDREALRWFQRASTSPDAAIAGQARQSYDNLAGQFRRVTTSVWMFPFFSSRFKDAFQYAQIKSEFRFDRLPVRPYLSLRFVGDARQQSGGALPQFLSESSVIAGVGLRTPTRHGLTLWAEAGQALNYLSDRPPGVPRVGPDYRGGVNLFRALGPTLGSPRAGAFIESSFDGVYLSRFDDNVIGYIQLKPGYRLRPRGDLNAQLFWNLNLTLDANRAYWANYFETGPGFRMRVPGVSSPMDFSVSVVRGVHLENAANPMRPNYYDIRVGLWYSFAM